jgi:hypothetical protein
MRDTNWLVSTLYGRPVSNIDVSQFGLAIQRLQLSMEHGVLRIANPKDIQEAERLSWCLSFPAFAETLHLSQ